MFNCSIFSDGLMNVICFYLVMLLLGVPDEVGDPVPDELIRSEEEAGHEGHEIR